jgi:hypothetical protein
MTAPGEHSWPLVAWASFLLNAEQSNCNKLRGLVEYVYWTQTSETADDDLSRYELSPSPSHDWEVTLEPQNPNW